MKDKILKIQNGAKSLKWGCTRHSETEDLFVVGHKSYPRQVYCFTVSDDLKVCVVSREHRLDLVKSCKSESEVLKTLYELLKNWFPAKGVSEK